VNVSLGIVIFSYLKLSLTACFSRSQQDSMVRGDWP